MLECGHLKNLVISEHAYKRMFERDITEDNILDAIKHGELIDEYEYDKPYPSYLILHYIEKNKPIHLLIARDEVAYFCTVVSVYVPDTKIWNSDFRTKKPKK